MSSGFTATATSPKIVSGRTVATTSGPYLPTRATFHRQRQSSMRIEGVARILIPTSAAGASPAVERSTDQFSGPNAKSIVTAW